MDWTTLLFRFEGRINRAKYWLAVLIYFVALMLLMIALFILLAASNSNWMGDMAGGGLLLIGGGVVLFLVFVWTGFATAIKRLHDRGKSGWWVLLFYILPSILGAIADAVAGTASLALHLISAAFTIWGFVEVGCLRGTQGPNEYGPDPLGTPALAHAVS